MARSLVPAIVLFSWTRNVSPHCLSPARCITWVHGDILLGVTLQWTSIPSGGGGVAILSVKPCGCPVALCVTLPLPLSFLLAQDTYEDVRINSKEERIESQMNQELEVEKNK